MLLAVSGPFSVWKCSSLRGASFSFFGTCVFRTDSEPRPLQQGMAKMFWRLTGVCSLKRVASGVPEVEKTGNSIGVAAYRMDAVMAGS